MKAQVLLNYLDGTITPESTFTVIRKRTIHIGSNKGGTVSSFSRGKFHRMTNADTKNTKELLIVFFSKWKQIKVYEKLKVKNKFKKLKSSFICEKSPFSLYFTTLNIITQKEMIA